MATARLVSVSIFGEAADPAHLTQALLFWEFGSGGRRFSALSSGGGLRRDMSAILLRSGAATGVAQVTEVLILLEVLIEDTQGGGDGVVATGPQSTLKVGTRATCTTSVPTVGDQTGKRDGESPL